MNILDHQQVLDHEFRLLNEGGPTLSNFYIYQPEKSFFISPAPQTKAFMQKTYPLNCSNLQTTLNHPNSVFHILTTLLLKTFYEMKEHTDLLQHLKCTLYSEDIKINIIEKTPYPELSSKMMKKILVEFFQIMQYHQGKVEEMLDKYPIVMDIFTLFLRTVLSSMGVKGASNYHEVVQPEQVFTLLWDYFDIIYQVRKGIYLLGEGELFVLIDKENQILYGNRLREEDKNDPEKDEEWKVLEPVNKQFNLIINQSPLDQLENPSKDLSTPTPHFPELKEEQMTFTRRSHHQSSKKHRSTIQDDDDMIRQTNEYEDEESSRDMHSSNNTIGPPLFKVHYDESDDFRGNMMIQALQSPYPSSPSTDVIESKQVKILPSERKERSLPKNYSKEKSDSYIESKSDIYQSESPGRKKRKGDDSISLYSCTCSESKIKKNSLHSGTVDINFREDFKRKHSQSGIEYKSFRNLGYSPQQPLSFLQKASPYQVPSKNMKLGNTSHDGLGFSRRNDKPKVYFTYNQKPPHIYTEPSFRSYNKTVGMTQPTRLTQEWGKPSFIKSTLAQESLNRRTHRNYAHQQVQYR